MKIEELKEKWQKEVDEIPERPELKKKGVSDTYANVLLAQKTTLEICLSGLNSLNLDGLVSKDGLIRIDNPKDIKKNELLIFKTKKGDFHCSSKHFVYNDVELIYHKKKNLYFNMEMYELGTSFITDVYRIATSKKSISEKLNLNPYIKSLKQNINGLKMSIEFDRYGQDSEALITSAEMLLERLSHLDSLSNTNGESKE